MIVNRHTAGENLRTARQKKAMLRTDLSARANVTESALKLAEEGHVSLNQIQAESVGKVLDILPSILIPKDKLCKKFQNENLKITVEDLGDCYIAQYWLESDTNDPVHIYLSFESYSAALSQAFDWLSEEFQD